MQTFRRSTDARHTDSLGGCWERDLRVSSLDIHAMSLVQGGHMAKKKGHHDQPMKSHENTPVQLECSDQILPLKNCICTIMHILYMYADMLQTSSNRFTFFCHLCSGCRPSYALSLRIPACREDPCAHENLLRLHVKVDLIPELH